MTDTIPPVRWPFDVQPACIGMVHLPALPGSPQSELPLSGIRARAVGEARMLADAGFDGVMVENFGDVPFFPDRVEPHTLTAMAVVVAEICQAVTIPVGVAGLVITSIILGVKKPWKEKKKVSLVPSLSPMAGGLSLQGSF